MSDLFSAVDVTFCFNAHSWRKTVGDSLRYCTARIASVVMWKLLSCVRPQFFTLFSVSYPVLGGVRAARRMVPLAGVEPAAPDQKFGAKLHRA